MPDSAGQHGVEAGIGVQRLEFFACAMEDARQTVELGIEHVDRGLEDADAAEIPGGGDEFIEEGLLEGALGLDFALVTGEQVIEGLEVLRLDDQLLGSEAVLEGVLQTAGLAFFSAGAGAELRVGGPDMPAGQTLRSIYLAPSIYRSPMP